MDKDDVVRGKLQAEIAEIRSKYRRARCSVGKIDRPHRSQNVHKTLFPAYLQQHVTPTNPFPPAGFASYPGAISVTTSSEPPDQEAASNEWDDSYNSTSFNQEEIQNLATRTDIDEEERERRRKKLHREVEEGIVGGGILAYAGYHHHEKKEREEASGERKHHHLFG